MHENKPSNFSIRESFNTDNINMLTQNNADINISKLYQFPVTISAIFLTTNFTFSIY